MKLEKTLIAALLILVYASPFIGYSITTNPAKASVEIEFVESDSYTDIQFGSFKSPRKDQYVLDRIKESIVSSAVRSLPDGYRLSMKITNIDLAGDRSPLSSTFGEYRVFRDIFPPRIAFEYEIRDSSERVIESGSEALTDLNYRNNLKVALHSDKTAAYVNDLVSSWVRRDMRRLVANEKE